MTVYKLFYLLVVDQLITAEETLNATNVAKKLIDGSSQTNCELGLNIWQFQRLGKSDRIQKY